MIAAGVSRRKQARPQRVLDDKDNVGLLNGGDKEMGASDWHVCGVCSGQFTTIHTFLAHKQSCAPQTPVDLSNKSEQDHIPLHDSDTKQSSIYDESSGMEIGSDLMCMYCMCALPSQGALLWHTVSQHAEDMPLECVVCQEQFSTPKQLSTHCADAHKELTDADLDRPKSCPLPNIDRDIYERFTDSAPPAEIMSDLYLASVDRLMLHKSSSRSSSRSGLVIAECEMSEHVPGETALDLSSPAMAKAELFNHLLSQNSAVIETSNLYSGKLPLPFSLNSIMSNDSHGPWTHKSFNTLFRPQMMRPDLPPGLSFGVPPVPSQQMLSPPGAHEGGGNGNGNGMDDDWESMMEISNIDENEKIRQLVGDKAPPVTDPNQCLLCRRILSCKSALQMHYRTHTGERPFKCKICQRAFTTKGNLKTHMGVHRSKHPFRMFHQCPICQKRFFTAQLLQQHIRLHTSQLTAAPHIHHPEPVFHPDHPPLPNDHIESIKQEVKVEDRPESPTVEPKVMADHQPVTSNVSLAGPINVFMQSPPISTLNNFVTPTSCFSIPTTSYSSMSNPRDMPSLSPRPNTTCNICCKVFACNSALEIHYRHSDCRSHTKERPFKCNVCNRGFSTKGNMKQHMLTHKIRDMEDNETSDIVPRSSCSSVSDDSRPPTSSFVPGPIANSPQPTVSIQNTIEFVSKEDKPIMSPFNPNPITPLITDTNPLDAIKKMWDRTEASPPKKTPQLAKHQCGVCFKHFSSSSALQIHMRTHTGDKPFKCPVCSRAFTTKGNLKVHMGTHMSVNPSRRGRRIFDLSSGPPFSPFTSFRNGLGLPLMGLPPTTGSFGRMDGMGTGTEDSEQSSPASSLGQGECTNRSPRSDGSSDPLPEYQHITPPTPDLQALLRAAAGSSVNNGGARLPLGGYMPGIENAPTGGLDTMMWMWRHVCSVCHKICQGSAQLEEHLKTHLNAQSMEKSTNNTAVA